MSTSCRRPLPAPVQVGAVVVQDSGTDHLGQFVDQRLGRGDVDAAVLIDLREHAARERQQDLRPGRLERDSGREDLRRPGQSPALDDKSLL